MPRKEETVRRELIFSTDDDRKLDDLCADAGGASRVSVIRALIRTAHARSQRRKARNQEPEDR